MPLNQNKMKDREEKEGSNKGGQGFSSGQNRIRILPPTKKWLTEEIDRFDFQQWIHYGTGPEGSPPVACLRDGSGSRCPLCTVAKKLKGNKAVEQTYRSIVAKPGFWMNIFEPDHPEKGIQRRRIGPKIREVLHQVAGDRSYGDILHPVTGRTFVVTMVSSSESGTGYNQYTTAAEGSPSSIKDLLPKGWADELEKLQDEMLKPITLEEMTAIANEVENTVVADALEAAGQPIPPKYSNQRAASGSTPSGQQSQSDTQTEIAAADRTPADAGPPPAGDKPPSGTPANSGEHKKCFGETYEPGSPECEACGEKDACVDKFCN